MDDLSLLREYTETGSSRAFALLVEHHVDFVYSAALRRTHGDPHRAAEVTQMVFVDFARKAAQLVRHPSLAGWLHQSTRWSAATALRTERRRKIYEQAAAVEIETDSGTGVGETADWGTLRPLLDNALDQLRESDREAVLLRFFSNLSFADIAVRFGVGENAARMRVERALGKLHRALRRHGIASSSAALAVAMSQHAVTAAPVEMTAALAPASIAVAAATTATESVWITLANFLMTKAQLGLLALALALAVGLSCETSHRAGERDALDRAREKQNTRRAEVARLATRAATEQQILKNLPSIDDVPPPDPIQLERKRLDLIVRKGELDGAYAAIFRRLKLDRTTLDALKTLIVERNQAIYDAQQVAKEEKVEIASYAENSELEREATRATDRQIAALLGPEKFGQFDRYVSTEGARRMMGYFLATPFEARPSEERVDALVTLFEKTSPDYFGKTWSKEEFQPLPEAFLIEAKSVMTPESYDRLVSFEKSAAVTSAARIRMAEIAREAAYQGKLKLSKSSARIYNPPKTDAKPADPVAGPATRTPAP